MNRTLVLAITALSIVLVSLVFFGSTTRAQQPRKPVTFDTGIVPLGMNQKLRLSITGGDFTGDSDTIVGFRGVKYSQGACTGDACRLVNVGTTTAGPLTLAAGEGATFELVATTFGRGLVTSNRRDVRVTASIINTVTGETTNIIMANTEGDFH